MLMDGKGLESGVKFAVATTYEMFNNKWNLKLEKLQWVDLWSSILETLTVEEINIITDHCVKEFRKPPVPIHFIELAKRLRSGRNLNDPIISKVERIAFLILNNAEMIEANYTQSELSDALLIAGAIAHSRSCTDAVPDMDREYVITEYSDRARMFAVEAEDWKADAKEGKGFWKDAFKPNP